MEGFYCREKTSAHLHSLCCWYEHVFPCSPQGGKIPQLYPTCCIGKTILAGIYCCTCMVKASSRCKSSLFVSILTPVCWSHDGVYQAFFSYFFRLFCHTGTTKSGGEMATSSACFVILVPQNLEEKWPGNKVRTECRAWRYISSLSFHLSSSK